jgi:hypothetical protein
LRASLYDEMGDDAQAEQENLEFRSVEFVAQLQLARAGSLPQEDLLDASLFGKLLHCVLNAEASAHAAIEGAGGGGWNSWCWPRVRSEMEWHFAVVVGGETEERRSARRAHFNSTATFPQFLLAVLQGLECRATRLRAVCPPVVWTKGNWLVYPSPHHFDYEKYAHDPAAAVDDCARFRADCVVDPP